MPHECPVCGFDRLKHPPRSASGGGSYEICPACGFQFGVDDDDRGITFAQWRREWIGRGSPWSSHSLPKPAGWPPGPPAHRGKADTPQAHPAQPRKSGGRAKRGTRKGR
ncbi:MAG: hypothetical protein KA004_17695 [Verrucomicrobiales bacterium]|nr:hypothetical protein [Verrucomicrobiales bacterium]